MSYLMLSGMGAIAFGAAVMEFNAEAVWADCLAGSSCKTGKESTCGASKRCGQQVQAALNALGYGPLTVDGQIGTGTIAALKRFSADNGFGTASWPTKPMLIKMEELLKAGEKPGPGPAVESHVVGGEIVPGAAPGGGIMGAGMSTGLALGLGAIALVGVGALAFFAKKKGGPPSKSATVRI